MVDLEHLSLLDITPHSIASDSQVSAMMQALDPELQSVSRDIREALIISRVDELSEPVLDLLAWQWHVDFYEPDKLPIATKRRLVKSAIASHRKKGTRWAVEQVLMDITGFKPVVHEWFEIGLPPYTFAVAVNIDGDPRNILKFEGEQKQLLIKAIEAVKPARAALEYFAVIPIPPDIPEYKPGHLCIHDCCRWSHGLYPGADEIVFTGIRRDAYSGLISQLEVIKAFTYEMGAIWNVYRLGDIPAKVGIYPLAQQCVLLLGESAPSWSRSESIVIAYANGVYSDNQPVGDINCAYSPRYAKYPPAQQFGVNTWGDIEGGIEFLPIYRYKLKNVNFYTDFAASSTVSKTQSTQVFSGVSFNPTTTGVSEIHNQSRTTRRITAGGRWDLRTWDTDDTWDTDSDEHINVQHSGLLKMLNNWANKTKWRRK